MSNLGQALIQDQQLLSEAWEPHFMAVFGYFSNGSVHWASASSKQLRLDVESATFPFVLSSIDLCRRLCFSLLSRRAVQIAMPDNMCIEHGRTCFAPSVLCNGFHQMCYPVCMKVRGHQRLRLSVVSSSRVRISCSFHCHVDRQTGREIPKEI